MRQFLAGAVLLTVALGGGPAVAQIAPAPPPDPQPAPVVVPDTFTAQVPPQQTPRDPFPRADGIPTDATRPLSAGDPSPPDMEATDAQAGQAQDQGVFGQVQQTADRWGVYIKGTFGLAFSTEDEIEYSPLWGIGAGFELTDSWRFEVAANWRDRFIVDGARGFVVGGNPIDSRVENRTVMGLAFYQFADADIPLVDRELTPYLGGGLGWSRIEVDDSVVLDPDTNDFTQFLGGDETQFAWQIGAGVQGQISQRLLIDLAYRFVNLGDVQLTSVAGEIDENLRTHEFVVSLGFSF